MGEFRPLKITTSSPLIACLMIHSLKQFGAASLPRNVNSFFGLCIERDWVRMQGYIIAICNLLDSAHRASLRKTSFIFLSPVLVALASGTTVALTWARCRRPLELSSCGWKINCKRATPGLRVPSWPVYFGISGNARTQRSFGKKMRRTQWLLIGARETWYSGLTDARPLLTRWRSWNGSIFFSVVRASRL